MQENFSLFRFSRVGYGFNGLRPLGPINSRLLTPRLYKNINSNGRLSMLTNQGFRSLEINHFYQKSYLYLTCMPRSKLLTPLLLGGRRYFSNSASNSYDVIINESLHGLSKILKEARGLAVLCQFTFFSSAMFIASFFIFLKFASPIDKERFFEWLQGKEKFTNQESKITKLTEEKENLQQKLDIYKEVENIDELSQNYQLIRRIEDFQQEGLKNLTQYLNGIKNDIHTVFDKRLVHSIKRLQADIEQRQKELKILEQNAEDNKEEIAKLKEWIIHLKGEKNNLEVKGEDIQKALESSNLNYNQLENICKQIFSGGELKGQDMQAFYNAWNQNGDFKNLEVSRFAVSSVALIMQQRFLSGETKEINFSGCALNKHESKINALSDVLSQLKIEKLNLEHNYLHHYMGAKEIAKIIRNTKTIKLFILNNNSLNDADITIIANALKENNSIEKLILHTNSFTVSNVKEILQNVVNSNEKLQEIEVGNNRGVARQCKIEKTLPSTSPRP